MKASWTTPADIRARLQKMWDQGRLLTARLANEPLFPLTLHLRGPDSKTLLGDFAAARTWAQALEEAAGRGGYQITYRTIHHRQLGTNQMPESVIFETERQALRVLKQEQAAETASRLANLTLAAFPCLEPWVHRNPLKLLTHAEDWGRVLAVLEWFRAHPRPHVYMREIDAPGVDTKFIESRRSLLMPLLDAVLPPEAITASATGAAAFETRYGLRRKPALVRFRLLDPALADALPWGRVSDISVPAQEFANLTLPVRCVVITENEINGLAFPDLPGGMVLFGLGYGLERLADCAWLHSVPLLYWGDIDTHGFAILSRLRGVLPNARSLLMDRQTLLDHRTHWSQEKDPCRHPLASLTEEEEELYATLVAGGLGERVRLEQERIRYGRVFEALRTCTETTEV